MSLWEHSSRWEPFLLALSRLASVTRTCRVVELCAPLVQRQSDAVEAAQKTIFQLWCFQLTRSVTDFLLETWGTVVLVTGEQSLQKASWVDQIRERTKQLKENVRCCSFASVFAPTHKWFRIWKISSHCTSGSVQTFWIFHVYRKKVLQSILLLFVLLL